MTIRRAWRGVVQFALMAIPIQLYKATEQEEKFPFKQLHAGSCLGQVGYKNYCKACEKEVASEEIAKGYEWQKGSFVEVTKDDIGSVKLATTGAIEIVGFVNPNEIAPAFYDESYYAGTDVGGEKAFAVLREALLATKRVAVGRIVIRGREDFLVIRPAGASLLVQMIRYKHEVRSAEIAPSGNVTKIAPVELDMAKQLVAGLTVPFDEIETPNRYATAMREMIERKRLGHKIEPTADTPRAPVVDILQALRSSLEATKRQARKTKSATSKSASGGRRKAA